MFQGLLNLSFIYELILPGKAAQYHGPSAGGGRYVAVEGMWKNGREVVKIKPLLYSSEPLHFT